MTVLQVTAICRIFACKNILTCKFDCSIRVSQCFAKIFLQEFCYKNIANYNFSLIDNYRTDVCIVKVVNILCAVLLEIFKDKKLIVLTKCFHGRDDCKQFFFLEISSNTVLDFFISIVVHYLEIFHSQNHLPLSRVPLQLLVNRCVGKVVIY